MCAESIALVFPLRFPSPPWWDGRSRQFLLLTYLNAPFDESWYTGGYFHRNAIRGRAAQMGRVFDKKSLNMGPIFDPQIPKHVSIFRQNHTNFLGSQREPRKFSKKSLNMGLFFEQTP